jgi:hypothetical protein
MHTALSCLAAKITTKILLVVFAEKRGFQPAHPAQGGAEPFGF